MRDASAVAERLCRLLEEFLTPLLPPGFAVIVDHGSIGVDSRESWMGVSRTLTSILDQPGAPADLLTSASWSALSAVQDYVSEVTRELWPTASALPHALVAGDRLLVWYGEASQAELAWVISFRDLGLEQ